MAHFFIGDSFIFGVGVNHEDSIPAKTQNDLKEKGIKAEVWNLGTPGYGLVQYMHTLDYYLKYQPDHVIISIVSETRPSSGNDIWASRKPQTGVSDRTLKFSDEAFLKPMKKWLIRNSALWNALLYYAGPHLRSLWHTKREIDLKNQQNYEEGWEVLEQKFNYLKSLAMKYSFGVTILYIPTNMDTLKEDISIARRLELITTTYGFNYINGFLALAPRNVYRDYYPIDGHLTQEGCDKVAKVVTESMTTKIKGNYR